MDEVKKKDETGNEVTTGYKYTERYYNKKIGKHRKVSVTLQSKSSQAWNKATKILTEKIKKRNSESSGTIPTYKDAFKEYVTFKKPRWEASTYGSVMSMYKNHIEPYPINDYLITEISLLDVQRIVDQVQYDKELSERMAKQAKTNFTAVFRYFKSYHGIDSVDLTDIQIEKDKKGPVIYIDAEDLPQVLDDIYATLNLMEAQLIETQILTGMRIGEATALTKHDVGNGKIIINKSVDSNDRRKIKDTKNQESIRIIESSERLEEIFKERITYNDIVFGDESDLIFANSNNRPPIARDITEKLKIIHPDYSTHAMRRTHISLLSENNFPLKYIMERVGHANPDTTLKIYTAVTEKQKKETAEKLNKLF